MITAGETGITGPWMHHGNFPSLKDVIEFYNLGNPSPIQKGLNVPDSLRNVPKSPILRKLNLDITEQRALEAFLGSISTRVSKIMPPQLPQ